MADGDKSQSRLSEAEATTLPPEALLICSECRAALPPSNFAAHLRRVHGIYQFRGLRRSFNDTFAVLLDALIGEEADAEAWRVLSAIAVENHGARGDAFLAGTLASLLNRVGGERRKAVVDSLGAVIGHSGAVGLAALLADAAETLTRRLVLAIVVNLPQPFDAVLLPSLRGLLQDRRLPIERRFAALAVAVGTAGVDSPMAQEFLPLLANASGKAKSIERLRRFERRAGKSTLLDALCAKLEDQVRMSCPRCAVQLRRRDMIEHLWQEHRLVLDGRRVREAWPLIEEWLERYCRRPEAELLDRCRTLAQRLDADRGRRRFHRLLLAHGIADDEARRDLLDEASAEHAALCPGCYALVPLPREAPPLRLNRYRGRLSAGGYRVEVSDRRPLTSLEIVTPRGRLYHGRESGQRLTRRGAMFAFAGPLVLLAAAWAFAPIVFGIKPLTPVLFILFAALLVYLLTLWSWRPRVPIGVRARNYAWTLLAPRLHADGYCLEDSAFLAGLALFSAEDGFAPLRGEVLPDALKRTENALLMGLAPANHLAALHRLAIEDAVAAGANAVPLLLELLARCFEGRLSLRFAEHLLADWHSSWWTDGDRARLRVLLCERAFEAGFEVRNLLDAGRTAPALGLLLATDNIANLAALRLLWSLRATQPWDRCGDPHTVFDLAVDPQRAELIGCIPDLLLWQSEADWLVAAPGVTEPRPAQIALRGGGVQLQDVLFERTPRVVEVNARWRYNDLVLGEHRFRSSGSLDALALRMERWFRYAFSEFLPAVPPVEHWKAPDRIAILRAWGAVACPECRRQLLPRVGEIGIALQDEDKAKT